MGNSSTKTGDKGSLLSKEEFPLVGGCFKNLSKTSEKIKEDELMVSINILFQILFVIY